MNPVNNPASLPPPEKTASGDPIHDLTRLLEELRKAARKTGADGDGPLSPLLQAFALILEWLGIYLAENRRITLEYGSQSLQRLQASKDADKAAVLLMQNHMNVLSLQAVTKLQDNLAEDFRKIMARQTWIQVNKIRLIRGSIFFASIWVSILGGIAYGYQWGQSTGQNTAEASIHETEFGLRTAFKYGSLDAKYWLGLMTWNDIEHSLTQCYMKPKLQILEHGRRACKVQLWIEEDKNAPDYVMDDLTAALRQAQADLKANAEKIQAEVKEVEEKRAAVRETEEKEAEEKARAAAQAKPKPVPDRGKTSR